MSSVVGTISIIIVGFALGLLWLAFIHQIRGDKLTKESRNSTGINFTTNCGEYRIDKSQQNFKYRAKDETNWKVMHFESITGIYYDTHCDGASWFEFFLSDWSLWDIHGEYRDVTNVATVELSIAGGARIPIIEIRQYEQRELWLGQWSYELHIKLLKMLKLYYPLDDVTDAWIDSFIAKCKPLGLMLEKL